MSTKHRRWTAEQKREFVLQYTTLPHGSRGAFARQVGVDATVIGRWRRQMAAGSLEQGLVPREGRLWLVEDNREVARLVQRAKVLEAKVARLEAEKTSQARVIEALGKAIELLRDVRAGKGSKE